VLVISGRFKDVPSYWKTLMLLDVGIEGIDGEIGTTYGWGRIRIYYV